MRRDTELRDAVHFLRTDLNFERLTVHSHDRGMQGLIFIRLRIGDIILDPPGERLPFFVYFTQKGVAFPDVLDDDAKGGQIVDLVEGLPLVLHLFIDGIEVLGPPEYFAYNPVRRHHLLDFFDDVVDEFLALRQFFVDVHDERFVSLGIEIFKA